MSDYNRYVINKTDGNVLVSLQDGTTNTTTGLTLIGRNYVSYGEKQNENFVKLLENFAAANPPSITSLALTPMTGTLWYDTANSVMKVYDGVNWYPVSQHLLSATAPTAKNIGDQWFDTTNQQLKVWTGTSWSLVGPAYTSAQGVSGVVIGTIIDSASVAHTVANTYVAGNLISITSNSSFTPAQTLPGFGDIYAGVNISGNVIVNGTASNSNAINGVQLAQLARVDAAATFASDVAVGGNLKISNANVSYANNTLTTRNFAYQGNVDVVVNSVVGPVTALNVNGSTGAVSLYANPIAPKHAATKSYVDEQVNSIVDDVENVANEFYANIELLQADYLANVNVINTSIAATNANVIALEIQLNTNIAALSASTTASFNAASANAASQQSNITGINSYLSTTIPTLAPLNSPNLVGTPTTTNVAALNSYVTSLGNVAPSFRGIGDTSNRIATTAYVDYTANVLYGDYLTRISTEALARNAAIATAIAPLATIASPAFTGTPTAPTPSVNDNSTKIATTAYVSTQIAAQQFRYTVSTSGPSGGNNGDFWFRIG